MTMCSNTEGMNMNAMSSAAASPAKTSALLGAEPVLPESAAGFGVKWLASLAWLDRNTSSWKTWQRCLVEGWATFSETWPRSGLMRNGTAYQLPPLVPLTGEIASGLWPTPRANDRKKLGNIANDPRNGLPAAARYWPTPISRDKRTVKGGKRVPNARGSEPLITVAAQADGLDNGRLNPRWVEWLMGFPDGWTELAPSEMPSSRKSQK
jgi:hypothetical protein